MKQAFLRSLLLTIDIAFLIAIFFVALYIRTNFDFSLLPSYKMIDLQDFLFVIFILVALLYYEGIYTHRYDFWQEMYKILRALFIGFLIVLAILTLTKTNTVYSRAFITIYFTTAIVLFPLFKRYSKKLLFMFKFLRQKVLIVGISEEKKKLKNEIEENWYLGQESVLLNYDTVIIISKGISIEKVNQYISFYINHSKELYLIPFITNINFAHSNILEFANIRLNAIQVENKLLIFKNILVKNIFDKIFAIIIFIPFSILHAVISVFILLDSSGNVFFRQKRLGKDGKIFFVYKYRTMYENGNKILEAYLKNNVKEEEYYNIYHKYQNDPRITKIGKILRSTSLDELPQIINVLKGEMSIVGPRPYMIEEEQKMKEDKEFILKVKPGITGLWQVSGRSELTFDERIELEKYYIKNWSLWIDFIILIKTIKVVLLKVGAK